MSKMKLDSPDTAVHMKRRRMAALLMISASISIGLCSCTETGIQSESGIHWKLIAIGNAYQLRCWEREILNGQHYIVSEEYKKARSEFRKALPHASSLRQANQTRGLIAEASISLSDFSAALPLLAEILDTVDKADFFTVAKTWASMGFCQHNLKRPDEASSSYMAAINTCRQAVEYKHDDLRFKVLLIDTCSNMADSLRFMKKETEAEQYEQEARLIHTSLQGHAPIDKLVWAISVSDLSKSPTKSIAAIEPLIKIDSLRSNTAEFKRAMAMLAGAYAQLGDDKKAEQTIDDLLSVMRQDPFVLNNDLFRVQYYFEKSCLHNGNLELCIRMGERALKSSSNASPNQVADVYFHLARAHHKLHERDLAKADLEKAMEYAKKDTNASRRQKMESSIQEMKY